MNENRRRLMQEAKERNRKSGSNCDEFVSILNDLIKQTAGIPILSTRNQIIQEINKLIKQIGFTGVSTSTQKAIEKLKLRILNAKSK
ncbi:MAG: hypothetical protein JW985_01390 [Alphaproteobacteria bacterium]|jgi:hypothetical protein|nr:hypothetical protein [Alphaproteobacteria bacterium]